jgi:hypothetical protein
MSAQPPLPAVRPCAPVPPIRSRSRLLAAVLAALLAALGLVMSCGLRKYTFEHKFHHDIDSPVLAVELASNAEELGAVLDPPSPDEKQTKVQTRAVLYTNTCEDCFFILLYTSFLWCFRALFAVRVDGSRMGLRPVLAGVVIATALADYAENFGIFKALDAAQLSDSLAPRTCWPSRCKWTLFGTALLAAIILLRSGSPIYSLATRRLLAIGYAITGGLMIAGVWYPALIGPGVKAFGLIVLINLAALLGPYASEWTPRHVARLGRR